MKGNGEPTPAARPGKRSGPSAELVPGVKIFLCYRRDDSAGHAGRVADRLCARFGPDAVFRDLDSIAPGRDFTVAINDAIDECDAVVAILGRYWLGAELPNGQCRLDHPDDFVRVEIATALERRVKIIPVLVNGAEMPSPESLPAPLAAFGRRNALELSESRWDYDIQRLVDVLDPSSSDTLSSLPRVGVDPPARRSKKLPAAGGVLALLALIAVVVLFRRGDHSSASGAVKRGATTTTTVVAMGDGQAGAGGPASGGERSTDAGQGSYAAKPGSASPPPSAPYVAAPSPTVPPTAPPTAPAPQAPPPRVTADAVAGNWTGTVSDGGGGTFYIALDVRSGCGLGERCGAVYVSGNNCRGDFTFYAVSNGRYEFTVDNFVSSGPNCSPGAGEYLTPAGAGSLAYTTNYGPYGRLTG